MTYEEQFIKDLATRLKAQHKTRLMKMPRNYAGAQSNRLTADWMTNNRTADDILKTALPKLRERSRDLSMNNDYAKSFLRRLKVNVIGPKGIKFQSKVKFKNGNLDRSTNEIIEKGWQKWIKKANASVCGTQSLVDILNTSIESIGRDGDIIIRKVKGYPNKFRFALQMLEADHLDDKLNAELPNGNTITMGVEKNTWGKPIAYHLFKKHPGDGSIYRTANQRIRIPADEIIHPFIKERSTQSRGVPWFHTSIIRLRMLGAYEEAELVAARVNAAKMGFIIPPEGENYAGEGIDSNGDIITEVEPGLLEQLPAGSDFKLFDPNSPSNNFQMFQKAMLRGVAAGIGCSYNSLASDLEGVNFSSLRSGHLEDRDAWKVIQSWLIENIIQEIFHDWLPMAILSGQVLVNPSDMERLIAPKWQARTWDWVDPLKDVNARIAELDAGLTTRTAICAERGVDFEEVLEQLAEEKKLMEELGIVFNPAKKEQPSPSPTTSEEQNPEEDDEGNLISKVGGGNGRKEV